MAGNTWFINVKSKGIKKTNRDVKKLKGNMGGLNKTVRNLAIGFGALYLGKSLLGAAKGAIETAGQFESLRIRLNNMYGSVQRGGQAFDEFNKIAATTPFQLKNVVEAGASLKAFGVDAENMIKPVSDLAAFMGVDVVEAAQAMGRAFAGGAGAADVLRDRGILQLIKDSQGIKDLSKLTIPEFRDVMVKALSDPSTGIVGATDKLAKSWEGTISNFKDGVDRLKAAIGTALIAKLKPLVEKVNATLSKMGEIGWDNIAQAFAQEWKKIFKLSADIAVLGGGAIGKSILLGSRNALIAGWAEGVGGTLVKLFGHKTHIDAIDNFFIDLFGGTGERKYQTFIRESNEQIVDELFDAIDKILPKMGLIADVIIAEAEKIKEETSGIMDDVLFTAQDPNLFGMPEGYWGEQLEQFKSIKEAEQKIYMDSLKSQTDAFKAAGVSDADVAEWVAEQKKKYRKKDADDQLKQAGQLAGSLAALNKSAKGSAKVTARLQQTEAIINTYAAANKALATYPPPFSYVAAAATVAAGLANVIAISQGINDFATGGSFVTGGEQIIRVGDNPSGREIVNVIPLDAAGEPTGGGGEVNIVFPGNVMSEQFIEEQAIPQIKEAIRRGADIGIG